MSFIEISMSNSSASGSTATDAACVVSITPLDAAPAPAQASLTIQGSGTAYFTGFAFDAPGDYRYTVTQAGSGRPYMTCDTAVYTVTVRVTGRADEAVQALLAGTLSYQPDYCCQHHAGDTARLCGSHTCSAACYHEKPEE